MEGLSNDDLSNHIGFLFGLVVTSLGTALCVLSSFNRDFFFSTIGMMGLTLGVMIGQRAFDDDGFLERASLRNLGFFVVGCTMMASGFTFMVNGGPTKLVAFGGVMLILGFITAHEGVDGNVI